MFFEHIVDVNSTKDFFYLNSNWCINIPGLVRVPFFDYENPKYGYVVYYSESKQEYGITKFLTSNGDVIWVKSVCNGGYGTPVVYGNIIICHKEFDSIIALNKETGEDVWTIKTQGRIRTSISKYSGFCYFATAGLIYKVNQIGETINVGKCDGVFFYGNILKYKRQILILGVEFNKESQKSILSLYIFDSTLTYVGKIVLGTSPVVSADTSGFFCIGNYAIVTCHDKLYKINLESHAIDFCKKLEGIACRHIPISDGNSIFYTTLNGFVAAISLKNGDKIWKRKMDECSIVAPPSLRAQSLFIIADGFIYILNKNDGNILQSKVIGHAPYSAAILYNNHLYVGGGEPPMYGNLICFTLVKESERKSDSFTVSILDDNVDRTDKTLFIKTHIKCSSIEINPSAIADADSVKVIHYNEDVFVVSFQLKNNCIKGFYGIPIKLNLKNSNYCISTMFRLGLQSLNPLPSRAYLERFAQPIKQDNDLYSGAAIAQLLLNQYGKRVNQKDFREIIDYVKKKSKWKDADFQTWRLILKRVLSNPNCTLSDFIQSEEF